MVILSFRQKRHRSVPWALLQFITPQFVRKHGQLLFSPGNQCSQQRQSPRPRKRIVQAPCCGEREKKTAAYVGLEKKDDSPGSPKSTPSADQKRGSARSLYGRPSTWICLFAHLRPWGDGRQQQSLILAVGNWCRHLAASRRIATTGQDLFCAGALSPLTRPDVPCVCLCARALVACAQSCAGLSPITTGSPQYSRTQPHTLEKRPAAAAIQRGSRSPTRSCLAPLEAPIGWLGSVSRWDLHIYRHGCLVGVGPSGEAMACQLFFTIRSMYPSWYTVLWRPKSQREKLARSNMVGAPSSHPCCLQRSSIALGARPGVAASSSHCHAPSPETSWLGPRAYWSCNDGRQGFPPHQWAHLGPWKMNRGQVHGSRLCSALCWPCSTPARPRSGHHRLLRGGENCECRFVKRAHTHPE